MRPCLVDQGPFFVVFWLPRGTQRYTTLRVGNLQVDAVRHRVVRAGAELKLTPKEFELLSFLAKHAGRVVTHKQILTASGTLRTPNASILASCGRRSKSIRRIRV